MYYELLCEGGSRGMNDVVETHEAILNLVARCQNFQGRVKQKIYEEK
jgi:hypothetical protein